MFGRVLEPRETKGLGGCRRHEGAHGARGALAELLVVLAAGWHTTTTLQFPEIDESDMGAAVWTLPGGKVVEHQGDFHIKPGWKNATWAWGRG